MFLIRRLRSGDDHVTLRSATTAYNDYMQGLDGFGEKDPSEFPGGKGKQKKKQTLNIYI